MPSGNDRASLAAVAVRVFGATEFTDVREVAGVSAIATAVKVPRAIEAAIAVNPFLHKLVAKRVVDAGQINIGFTSDVQNLLMRVLSANLPITFVIIRVVIL
jgi:hypothetical protein